MRNAPFKGKNIDNISLFLCCKLFFCPHYKSCIERFGILSITLLTQPNNTKRKRLTLQKDMTYKEKLIVRTLYIYHKKKNVKSYFVETFCLYMLYKNHDLNYQNKNMYKPHF